MFSEIHSGSAGTLVGTAHPQHAVAQHLLAARVDAAVQLHSRPIHEEAAEVVVQRPATQKITCHMFEQEMIGLEMNN